MAIFQQNLGQRKYPSNWMVLMMLLFSGIYSGINSQLQSDIVLSIYQISKHAFQLQLCYYAGFATGGCISAVPITIFGYKKTILAVLIAEIIFDIILALSPGNITALIFTLRTMVAVLQSVLYCAASRWAITLINKRERGYIVVYFIVSQQFGGLITVVLASAEIPYLFYIITIICSIIILVLAIFTPDFGIANREINIFNNVGYIKSSKQFFNTTNLIMIFISGIFQASSSYQCITAFSHKLFYPYESTRHYGVYVISCVSFIAAMLPFALINWSGRQRCFYAGGSLSLIGLIYLLILYASLNSLSIAYPALCSVVTGTTILIFGYFTGSGIQYNICIFELLFDAWSVGITVFMANICQIAVLSIYNALQYNYGIFYGILLIFYTISYIVSTFVIIDAENYTLEEIQTKIRLTGTLSMLKAKLLQFLPIINGVKKKPNKISSVTSPGALGLDDSSAEECELLKH